MAITLAAINRIPSAHLRFFKNLKNIIAKFYLYYFSDIPVIRPKDVDYFPTEFDLGKISAWMKYQIGVQIARYHPVFAKCEKFNK